MDLLRTYVSPGALHNSRERSNAPRCHPETRIGLMDKTLKWLNDIEDPRLILWLRGSAGIGKSAVAESIASLCYKERRLLGGFFIPGSVPVESSGQSDERRLVSTLAYQMARDMPPLSAYITDAIERNPTIFELDISTQIDGLIIGPLSALSAEMSTRVAPMLILVDALDQLPNKPSQARIVDALSEAVVRAQHQIPVKIIIMSRPECNIQSAFMTPRIAPIARTISLDDDDDYHTHDDIGTLLEVFRDFRCAHPPPDIFPKNWPPEQDADELVE